MTYAHFPFYAIGFRANPFQVLTDEEWVEVAVIPSSLQKMIGQTTGHIQLVGAMGHGKSTTLLAARVRMVASGQAVELEYIPRGQHRLTTRLEDVSALILDEAQRLWPWEWWRLLRWAKKPEHRLIFSSHVDMRLAFQLIRLKLTTCPLDYSVCLAEILQHRLAYFALEDPPPITLAPDAIAYLEDSYGANLRAIQYFLYEVFQRFPSCGALTADGLCAVANDLQATK
ncbi:MAG: hypothetical protein H6673_01490 [Anaerolineales bacterium]|nr:hypothetical protein [Anaerolineales bacterium]